MGGGRRKFRQCRTGSFSGEPSLFRNTVSENLSWKDFDSLNNDGFRIVETFAPSAKKNHVDEHFTSCQNVTTLANNESLYQDPLLPRCRHNNSHAVPLRQLQRHEVGLKVVSY